MERKKKVIEKPDETGKPLSMVLKREVCKACVNWKAYMSLIKKGTTQRDADNTKCKGCDATGDLIEIKVE